MMETQQPRGMMNVAYNVSVRVFMRWLEANLVPDYIIRKLTRAFLARRLRLGYKLNASLQVADLMAFINALKQLPIAMNTEAAKTQHYELPTSFFKLVLGKHLKYSEMGLCNVVIFADDISKFEMENTFDRVISIEMFEHMKNYGSLLRKISQWMKPESLLFVHHFCHKVFAFHFEDIDEDDWITRYFFAGGTMPSSNLLLYFQDHVSVVDHWLVNGKHYAQTSEEWLKSMDKNLTSIIPIFNDTYGENSAQKWMAYWQTFFIAVVEFFGYNDGEEWMVSHLLFKKK